jgi:hypothetical protein
MVLLSVLSNTLTEVEVSRRWEELDAVGRTQFKRNTSSGAAAQNTVRSCTALVRANSIATGTNPTTMALISGSLKTS